MVWTTDPGNRSGVRNGEEAFKTGENMCGAVQWSVGLTDKVKKLALFIKFHECSFHKIKRKISKYCHMVLKMQPKYCELSTEVYERII